MEMQLDPSCPLSVGVPEGTAIPGKAAAEMAAAEGAG
jgi:hypothetical protein